MVQSLENKEQAYWIDTAVAILEVENDRLTKENEELKIKAAAYERLMGGSVQGMKEWANILGKPVAIDAIGRGWWFASIPKIINGEWEATVKALIPDLYIGGGISDWKDSVTLPDGWEER